MFLDPIEDILDGCHDISNILRGLLPGYFVHQHTVADFKVLLHDLLHLFVGRFMGQETVLVFTLEDQLLLRQGLRV